MHAAAIAVLALVDLAMVAALIIGSIIGPRK